VISKSAEVTSLVNPAQLVEVGWVCTTFPVVAGVVTFFPVVKDILPVVAGGTFPVVIGLTWEVVKGLAAEVVIGLTEVVIGLTEVVKGLTADVLRGVETTELNPYAGPDCSWYIV